MTVGEFEKSWVVTLRGAVVFAQQALPLTVSGAEQGSSQYPPTLIFTGATASVKANAQMASFAAPKWGLRALSQSLARVRCPFISI